MPYLLQTSENRVENIKKKFENPNFCDRDASNPGKNYKSFTSSSKTKDAQILKSENSENDCDSRDKQRLFDDKQYGKSEINKGDGKAVVRRSPAFRRDKLNYGKSLTNLGSIKDNQPNERRKFNRAKVQVNKDSPLNVESTVKLNNLIRNKTEPNLVHLSQNLGCNSNNNLNSTITSKSPDPMQLDKDAKGKNVSEKIFTVKCSENSKCSPVKVISSDSKSELKLTDSIRLALKAPLPKGPPPKKPPRTFVHTTQSQIGSQEPLLGREDPTLRLKLEKIEKVVKSLEPRTQTKIPQEMIKTDLKWPPPNVTDCSEASHGNYAKPGSLFGLKGLNCISGNGYVKSLAYEKEGERQSSFHVDLKDCSKTDLKNPHPSVGVPLPLVPKKCEPEPIYDLPFITKKRSFESFGKVTTRNGGSNGNVPPQQLHYMCTDLVNSVQDSTPSRFSPPSQGPDCPGDIFHADIMADRMKNFFHKPKPVKKSQEATGIGDCKVEAPSNGVPPEPRSVIAKEEVKIIMKDVFNSVNAKLIYGQCNRAFVDVDSDSESASSGLEEPHVNPADGYKSVQSVQNQKKQGDRCLPTGSNRRDDKMSDTTASRKTYVKRVSSKLLNHSPYTKTLNSDSYTHLFESCILVGLTLGESKTTVPYIKSIFPSNVKPPPLIEFLCFPDASTWSQNSCNLQQGEQYYSLVITNENGDRNFGYCRRVLPEGGNFCLPLVYCIVSQHRANGFYYKVLQELESRHGSSELQAFIQNLYECSFPGPGQSLKFKKILEEVTRVSPVKSEDCIPSTLVRRPCDVRLEERDLSQLLQHLKVSVFLKVFSSLLLERKVLMLGHSLRNLSSCIEALQSLLIPFSWQHTFIPVLPNHLSEMCEAPTPYIIGLQKSTTTTQFLAYMNFEDGIMVDLEESQIVKSCGDEGSILPQRLIKGLKTALNLATGASLESDNDRNVLISEAFIRFFVEICGNYSYFIVKQPDGKKIFQKEEFVGSAPSIQSFLDWFVETAMFRSFIQERLQNDTEDLFKRRAMEHLDETDKSSVLFMKNYKGMNRKVRSLGDRIKDLTLFAK